MVRGTHHLLNTLNIPVLSNISLGAGEAMMKNFNDDFGNIVWGRQNQHWKYPESAEL